MHKNKLKISKNPDGSVTLENEAFLEKIDVNSLPFEKRAELLRWVILEKGLVFTRKLEKKVEKMLRS